MSANWKTSLWGSIQAIATGIVTGAIVFPTNWGDPKQVILFLAVIILSASGIKFAMNAKDRNVTGGSVAQTLSGNVAEPGTQSLVDATLRTTAESGESITSQQRQTLSALPKLLAVVAFLGVASLPMGCANQTVGGSTAESVRSFVNDIEPSLRPGASLACSLVLSLATTPADRAEVKNQLWVVASIVQSATASTTPGDLSKAIQAALPKTAQYKTLADAIAGGWGIALPYFRGDTALVLKVTGDLAGGCTDVAVLP